MASAKRIIFLLFCVTFSYGQRIPQALFEPVVVTVAQETRVQELDTISEKTQAEREELAVLFATTTSYKKSFALLETLVQDYPDNFEYQLRSPLNLVHVRPHHLMNKFNVCDSNNLICML